MRSLATWRPGIRACIQRRRCSSPVPILPYCRNTFITCTWAMVYICPYSHPSSGIMPLTYVDMYIAEQCSSCYLLTDAHRPRWHSFHRERSQVQRVHLCPSLRPSANSASMLPAPPRRPIEAGTFYLAFILIVSIVKHQDGHLPSWLFRADRSGHQRSEVCQIQVPVRWLHPRICTHS